MYQSLRSHLFTVSNQNFSHRDGQQEGSPDDSIWLKEEWKIGEVWLYHRN